MEMMVWQLRSLGDKLPPDALDGPHRGWLRLGRYTIADETTLHAGLYGSTSNGAPPMLPGLWHVEVRRMDERGILLLGRQSDPRFSHVDAYVVQAWFCALAYR